MLGRSTALIETRSTLFSWEQNHHLCGRLVQWRWNLPGNDMIWKWNLETIKINCKICRPYRSYLCLFFLPSTSSAPWYWLGEFDYNLTTPGFRDSCDNSCSLVSVDCCISRDLLLAFSLQVVPGRAGGGSFRRKKNYIAKKEFAYRMCARRPTSAMPKPFLCCERAFCCSMVVMWPVLMQRDVMWCGPMWFDAMCLLVLCHVTWCNVMSCDVRSRDELSSVAPCNGMEPKMPLVVRSHCVFEVVIQGTILYYKALLCTTKYNSTTTLYYTSTTPVLLCTTNYYPSTTLYYKVLLQYYSVLQSTTPLLLCTAKYYSSTTLYCKVLVQYCSVLQSTTPVLLCTAKC